MTKTLIEDRDISFFDEIGTLEVTNADDGQTLDALKIMKNNGVNAIRLHIRNEPAGGFRKLERTLRMAKQIKALHMHFLLDFHFNHKWAYPEKHSKPKNRVHLGREALNDQVFNYTYYVLSELKEQGTLPDIVRISSEITHGHLWNESKVDEEFGSNDHWDHYMTSVISGVVAAKSVDSAINIRLGDGGELQ